MSKKKNKFISILALLALSLALSVPVFAETEKEEIPAANINETGAAADQIAAEGGETAKIPAIAGDSDPEETDTKETGGKEKPQAENDTQSSAEEEAPAKEPSSDSVSINVLGNGKAWFEDGCLTYEAAAGWELSRFTADKDIGKFKAGEPIDITVISVDDIPERAVLTFDFIETNEDDISLDAPESASAIFEGVYED